MICLCQWCFIRSSRDHQVQILEQVMKQELCSQYLILRLLLATFSFSWMIHVCNFQSLVGIYGFC